MNRSARVPAASAGATMRCVSPVSGSGFRGDWVVALLKALVIGMGVLIVAGTVTLVALIVQRAGGDSGTMPPRALGQPAGTRITSIAGAEGRIAVLVTRPDGSERVLLVDGRSGRVVGELRAAE